MAYHDLDYQQLHAFCSAAFRSYGFEETTSREITDILLAADLNGIESHGVQRMVRYDKEIESGMVDVNAKMQIVHETPISAVIDGCNGMGQVVGRAAFSEYLQKLRESDKAQGCDRIYTHGEKEVDMRILRKEKGIPVNDKTIEELRAIEKKLGAYAVPFPQEL